MAVNWFSTFGHQVFSQVGGGGVTTGLTDRKWFDTVNSTPTWDATSPPPGCPGSMKVPAAATVSTQVQRTVGNTVMAFGCWFKKAAGNPGSAQRILWCSPTVCGFRIQTDGTVAIMANNAALVSVFTPTAATWYWLTCSVDVSGATAFVVGAAYDQNGVLVASQSTSSAVASASQTALVVGISGTNTSGVDQWMGCPVFATALADHPLPRYGGQVLAPSACGTHSFTLGDFKDTAGTNLATNETTSFGLIDEIPPTVTDFVQQTVINASGYVEYQFADVSQANLGSVSMVQLLAAMHPVAAATANTAAFRLNDNGTITAEAALDTSVASNTLEYRMHGYQTRPNGGGAWSTTDANALRGRFGYSGDATPPPALDAFYLEVLAPITVAKSAPLRRRIDCSLHLLGR